MGGCAHVEGRTVLLQGANIGERISPERVQVIAAQADSDRFERIAQLQYRTDGDNFDGNAEKVLVDRRFARWRRRSPPVGADASRVGRERLLHCVHG